METRKYMFETKWKQFLAEQSRIDPQRYRDFIEKYIRDSDGNAKKTANLYNRLEDASRSDAEKAEDAAMILKRVMNAFNTPEAVIQAAIQSIDNSNVLTQVKSMLGTGNLETWFYEVFDFDPSRQWHRGTTIADKFVEFNTY
jgi:phenylpyruvate tautomerase PptA (4-oxalocrotonate tautomerase family)